MNFQDLYCKISMYILHMNPKLIIIRYNQSFLFFLDDLNLFWSVDEICVNLKYLNIFSNH